MAVISTGFTGAVIIIMFIGVTGIDIKVVLLLCLYYHRGTFGKTSCILFKDVYCWGAQKRLEFTFS